MNKDYTTLAKTFAFIEDENFITEIESRYEFEDKIYVAISQGLPHLVPSIFDSFINLSTKLTKSYIINDYLSTAKYFCISVNLTGRLAALTGGVPSLQLHSISQHFHKIITEASDIDFAMYILPKRILEEYATAVAEVSLTQYSPLVVKIFQYISEHITEPLDAKQISSAMYICPEHLSRRFRAETGKNLPDYINCKRIYMAKILLSRNTKNITEVAIQVGYCDSSYFSKVFKKIEGISPREYVARLKLSKN